MHTDVTVESVKQGNEFKEFKADVMILWIAIHDSNCLFDF